MYSVLSLFSSFEVPKTGLVDFPALTVIDYTSSDSSLPCRSDPYIWTLSSCMSIMTFDSAIYSCDYPGTLQLFDPSTRSWTLLLRKLLLVVIVPRPPLTKMDNLTSIPISPVTWSFFPLPNTLLEVF